MKAIAVLLTLAGVVALAPASADEPCSKVEVEYTLSANLRLSNTPMGKGDGIYPVGPGTLVLRFEGDQVKVVSYKMHQSIMIHASFAVWSANVKTDMDNTATSAPCKSAGEGTIAGRILRWSTPVREHRTDGTIECAGSACGMFGAPRSGKSELHIGPGNAQLGTFYFSPDMLTFSMPTAPAMTTQSPKQTSQIAISGREVKRTCVSSSCR